MRGRVFEIARVTVELASPCRVASGDGDDLNDAVFAVDANGLPTLPGTSIAGVLRHAFAVERGAQADRGREARAFGFQETVKGQSSRVEVSFGHVHDSRDRPVVFRGADLGDDVLAFVAAGIPRDHVRISARGAVDGRGKHDELVVPAGARFTFELVIHADAGTNAAEMVGLLGAPWMRIGARTRSGLGRIRVVRAASRRFDLADARDRERFLLVPRGLHEAVPPGLLEEVVPARPHGPEGLVTGTLTLEPKDFWMVGRGDRTGTSIGGTTDSSTLCPWKSVGWCGKAGGGPFRTRSRSFRGARSRAYCDTAPSTMRAAPRPAGSRWMQVCQRTTPGATRCSER